MKVEIIESFEIAGFSVRTKNSNEMDTATSKIDRLWVKFGAEAGPLLSEKSEVYGIYTNYESDFAGEYDVIVGSDTLVDCVLSGIIPVQVQAGKYLVFSANGEIKSACVELWKEVWGYFNSENCEYERAYITDFESYTNCKSDADIYTSDVDIYIAIK